MQGSRLSYASFDGSSPHLSGTLKVYVATWGKDTKEITSFIVRYSSHPHFRGLVALADKEVVGLGFGHKAFQGNWWFDCLVRYLGENHPMLQNAWITCVIAKFNSLFNNDL